MKHVTLRVAIADDEPLMRLDLREMLQHLGHEVVVSEEDGVSVLSRCRVVRPDLAILDVKMRGMNGLEVAAALADEGICPTIIVSAFSDEELIARARESGCLSYLVKPIRPSDLGPAIAVAMAVSDRLACLKADLVRVQEALETRRFIDRAKGILMDKHGMTEDDAFRYIQLRSMLEGKPLRDVAQGIINGEFEPNWRPADDQG
jgi:response regulator NasT